MGNGAQVRALYGDSTLESHFYSQFSDSTADDHPVRFYYWDGAALAPLYGPNVDTFFQVGSDLLVFGRLEGARYAFLRGLAAGEHTPDNDYWLGWTELWLGHRAAAEAAWSSFGALDDSLRWWVRMRLARTFLLDKRDTLEARRNLAIAIRSGIGRPEAHAVLGDLMLQERPKYGLLELDRQSQSQSARLGGQARHRAGLDRGAARRSGEERAEGAETDRARLGARFDRYRGDHLPGTPGERRAVGGAVLREP
jgi:hypothetical protein